MIASPAVDQNTMKKLVLYVVSALVVCAVPAAAQVASAPTTTVNVKAADDFATKAFQDPWDMSQRTDVGWWTFGTDTAIGVNFQNPTVAGGVFSGIKAAGAPAALFLLESGLAPTPGGSATPVGKTGQQYPINTATYTHLVYRMNSSVAGVSQYVWSKGTIYDDMTVGAESVQSSTVVQTGWKVYDVNLTSLTAFASGIGSPTSWSAAGTIRSLQILPFAGNSAAAINLDWVRLVQDNNPALHQNITWTGAAAADVYLDTDKNAANGTLGRLCANCTTPFNFFVGALPAGQYFIAVHAPTAGEVTGTSAGFSYAAGSYVVNDIPTLTFTTPSDEGSSEEFATTRLGDPWDFTTMSDIDSTLPGFPGKVNVINDGITSLVLTNEAGVNLGPQTVYLAASAPASPASGNVGDPQIYTMFWDGKGKQVLIDPRRYRILTIDAGIPNKARSLPGGSIGRVIWRAINEPVIAPDGVKARAVGEHYAFNSAAGENTLAHIAIDMNKMPIEPGSFNPNTTWSSGIAAGGIDGFRFDPHEFSPSTQFFIKQIKLAALERTQNNTFTFRWTQTKAGTVTLFIETDPNHTFGGTSTQIGTKAGVVGANSFTWSVPGATANGEYQVWARIDDGTNQNQVYALTPLVVDHTNLDAQMVLNRTQLFFSTLGGIRTAPQTIRLTFSGTGNTCWQASSNLGPAMQILPASGTGAAFISIGPTSTFGGGTTRGLVTLQSCTNPSNVRNIAVAITGFNATGAPFGAIDTPFDGTVAAGSLAVTGWAADDLEVTAVKICRDPVPASEPTTPTLCGNQAKVFIGNATFVEDARPDIAAGNPTLPFNYRAGWGYLMLTNFLPNGGNGAITLYAYASDREGFVTLLGSKTITTQNATASKPFGAIDTPGQGEVICGTYANSGWALSRTSDVPANSSTIGIFIDDVFIGRPGARQQRSDITAAFPTFDTTHAVGGLFIDTTQFSNGVHTIYWIVSDNNGANDGIGSRFFTISNPCSGG
jgi:hypothetical protein